ncbi:MAG TPA: P1 family peptidase [Rhizomicrobium sp.]|jgi:L-aminopeptidase/D-esterase-like protein|nr:P1 family peptidase [Rhizomicrobium sp.]
MAKPGPRNLITDVAGLRVGQSHDEAVRTGVTVLIADEPATATIDVRGGAPGTRETDSLDPVNLVGAIDAIVLSGGSVYGLEAASGVTAWLAARGRGYRLAASPHVPPAPIVPAAILFDLANGGNKMWGDTPPYHALARHAAEQAAQDFALGNAGAGYGAQAGNYKGGTGSASIVSDDGFTVGALVAVNSVGSPLVPGTGVFWSFALEQHKEFGGRFFTSAPTADAQLPPDMKGNPQPRMNTTIAIVATDAALTRDELKRVAIMAADGLARAIRPAHTPFDGDVVFALSTAKKQISEPRSRDMLRIGHFAADCLSRAIARGVYEAQSLGDAKSYREVFPPSP